jgi:23S rRNA (cytidine1920-2'-O)/16S rRNA (cytidine1409-2'-O)-methyltransferase
VKVRLDQLLVERGLAPTRQQAQRLIRAGLVVAGDHLADKPGRPFDPAIPLRLKAGACPYVSRGGLKLQGALRRFLLTDLSGLTTLDIGASTGGFTDCLLAHGARRVWAVDTGRGKLDPRLASDPRVRLRERANARHLTPDWIDGERVNLITIDVSFISLRLVLPPLPAILAPQGSVLALVKPQFEAGRDQVGKGGVVRGRDKHHRVLTNLTAFARDEGWRLLGLCPSHPPGPAGNREFFLWLDRTGTRPALDRAAAEFAIEQVLNEIYNR